jgi:hypothetical protein
VARLGTGKHGPGAAQPDQTLAARIDAAEDEL